MSSSIVIPTPAQLGNSPPIIAAQLIAVATAAQADVNALTTNGRCRAVATTLAAYAGTGTGVLTASANGALGAQDGVSTLAVGDLLFLPEGLTNVTTADAGPWVITSVGGASAKYVLTRPSWWAHGMTIVECTDVNVGSEGTLFAGTTWKSFAASATKVVDTDAPLFFPGRVSQKITLVSGVKAITNVPLRSATQTNYLITWNTSHGTVSTTTDYAPTLVTPGPLNTATVTIAATSSPGTNQTSDASDLNLTIINW